MANDRDPNTTTPAERELVISRVFDAPRELVFKAWTEPEHLVRWWGPKGHTTPYCEIDLRPGGVMHHCMRSPEGRDVWSKGVFREIVVPERIVLTDSFADAQGNVVPPTHFSSPTSPTSASTNGSWTRSSFTSRPSCSATASASSETPAKDGSIWSGPASCRRGNSRTCASAS